MTELTKKNDVIILCIEDEVDLREVLVEEMQDAGYQVLEAGDGLEALTVLKQTRPDLILCDIAMPRMGGYELLEHIRTYHSDLADVPFIFLTAQDEAEQIVSGKHAGADDYLVKPVHFDLMLATIAARLRQMQRVRHKIQAEQQPSAVDPVTNTVASRVFQRISKTFDLISSGIVLLGVQSNTLFMNNTARAIISDGEGGDEIACLLDSQGDELFWRHSAIRRAIAAATQDEDYIDFLTLTRTGGQRHVVLAICALTAESIAHGDPVVALFFCHGTRNEPAPIKALDALFQLTPMESRVAWAFAQGMRPDEIAHAFSISMTTVAFHKRNIFQKTHINRQADLVALLLTLPASLH